MIAVQEGRSAFLVDAAAFPPELSTSEFHEIVATPVKLEQQETDAHTGSIPVIQTRQEAEGPVDTQDPSKVMPEAPDVVTKSTMGWYMSRTCFAAIVVLFVTVFAVQMHNKTFKLLSLPVSTASSTLWPYRINLMREMVPVKRGNRTVSHKTSFTGTITMGTPPQEFNMVFDTGSAHVLVPSTNCPTDSCIRHRRYNESQSSTATQVNADFGKVEPGANGDRANIGFGTGSVVGSFVHEKVCLGGLDSEGPCVDVGCIAATEMTDTPFLTSQFDGIFGLSFDNLAISPYFSFFKMLALSNQHQDVALQFGIFLADVGSTMRSELTLGGYNPEHLLTPLKGVSVTNRAAGYWQVKVVGVRVGGKLLDMCTGATQCSGIVDTGTSHLGVPWDYHREIMDSLSGEGVQGTDCRYIEGDTMEIMLDGLTLALTPENYMRPMALPPDVKFGSMTGQYGAGIGGEHSQANESLSNETTPFGVTDDDSYVEPDYKDVPWQCAPKVMPVKLESRLGKMFILGEPVLSRYYTVYDWGEGRISFGLNTRDQNKEALLQKPKETSVHAPQGERSEDDGTVLAQGSWKIAGGKGNGPKMSLKMQKIKRKVLQNIPIRKADKSKGELDDDGFFLLRLPRAGRSHAWVDPTR